MSFNLQLLSFDSPGIAALAAPAHEGEGSAKAQAAAAPAVILWGAVVALGRSVPGALSRVPGFAGL